MQEELFHYCSTDSFHSIVSTQSIRLSSLSLSNDTMEGKIVAQALVRLAVADGLDDDSTERLLSSFDTIERKFDGLGFCLSEEGDLLSQWRGYAADASGISIGFSTAYLDKLQNRNILDQAINDPLVQLHQVKYSTDEHDTQVSPAYAEVRKAIDKGAFRFSQTKGLLDLRTESEIAQENKQNTEALHRAFSALFTLFPKLFVLKSNAFREEREWRLLSHLIWERSDDCSYRPIHGRLIPYRLLILPKLDAPAITKVVLGPKHITPPSMIADFLKKSGFPDVEVIKSVATYR